MLAMFMASVEGTIVATAMPTIVADLGGFRLFSWVFAAYLLSQAVSTPIYGRLSDIFGRKPVFFGGATLFLLSSLACGFAWGMVPLICFRILQGLGAGAIQPIGTTIVGDIYGPADRARMQGWLSSIWGVSAITGPLLGGFIVQHLHWSLIFWINLPIGLVTMAILAVYFREQVHHRKHQVDYLGAALLMLGLGALMLIAGQIETLGATTIAVAGIVGLLALAALVLQERRAAEPVLSSALWRNRVLAIGNCGGFLIGALLMGVVAFLPTYVQGVMGRSATVGGFVIAAQSGSWCAAPTAPPARSAACCC
jgi:EmrB/QacA subfamily drug resistance transporter